MPATIAEVQDVIQKEFPGADASDIHVGGDRRIMGKIVWRDFRGMDVDTRNRLVTKRVRGRLGLRGLNVGLLFPLAPGERL